MRPSELVRSWVKAFNEHRPGDIAALGHEDAVNHQVAQDPIEGRAAIQAMLAREFAAADMAALWRTYLRKPTWRSWNGAIR